jgi:hypothetical protein
MRASARPRTPSESTDPVTAVVDDARAKGAPERVLTWLEALLRHGERADDKPNVSSSS